MSGDDAALPVADLPVRATTASQGKDDLHIAMRYLSIQEHVAQV